MTIPSPEERPDLYDGYDGRLYGVTTAEYLLSITPDWMRKIMEERAGKPFEQLAQEMEIDSRKEFVGQIRDRALAADPQGPMVRWSDTERLAVKAYLESLPADEWTKDDHYLMADYLFQRYLPADDQRTQDEWLEAQSRIRAKVDANIERAARGEPKPPPPPDDPDFALWLKDHLSGGKE